MAASGAHARQASVNEPSGARLFSGDWVELGHCAHDHGAQLGAVPLPFPTLAIGENGVGSSLASTEAT